MLRSSALLLLCLSVGDATHVNSELTTDRDSFIPNKVNAKIVYPASGQARFCLSGTSSIPLPTTQQQIAVQARKYTHTYTCRDGHLQG